MGTRPWLGEGPAGEAGPRRLGTDKAPAGGPRPLPPPADAGMFGARTWIGSTAHRSCSQCP
ncbi:hypothetical protein ACFPM0_02615 [Pseudonocardia sulfidoxydans]|uniref:hypothetical protein n=1 Tax=Pseudonocardia sulfidoxydans TaxID=54011 RepID=UPI003620F7A5